MGRKNIRKKVIAMNASSNPFNIKMNRQKHSILGQKVKGTQGLPGISQALSHAKRKDRLYKKKLKTGKANKFIDKRLMDGSLPSEEQAVLRLVHERKQKLKKSTIKLNEQEHLTHKGKPLHELHKYEGKSDESEDDEQLSANFVKQAHFGGFSSDVRGETPKSHKEIINDLIVESKIRKHEKKTENEENADLTEKLDNDWKNISALMASIKSNKPAEQPEKKDSYDVSLQELKFEMRATVSNPLKTAEEIERKEQEKFLKLEAERFKRMNDGADYVINNNFSADSIDDGFDIQPISVDETESRNLGDGSKPKHIDVEESDESMSESDNDNDEKEVDKETASLKRHTTNEKAAENEELSIPETRGDFDIIATSCLLDELPNKISSILNSNLPCKSEKRMSKLENFFSVLIEYTLEICENHMEDCAAFFPFLYDLAQTSPLKTGNIILSYLDQEQQSFQQLFSEKKKKCNLPLKSILLLNVCVNLYSVSDFRHPVMTPAYIFMCDILSKEYNASVRNILYRLFISRMILKCITDSKRFVPEVIMFLNKTLSLGVRSVDINVSVTLKRNVNLVLEKEFKTNISQLNLNMVKAKCNDATKMSIIFEIINQLQSFALLYSNVFSYKEIFGQTLSICHQLPLDKYPDVLIQAINLLKKTLSEGGEPLRHLVFRNTKPKPLKMLEPAFESKFSLKKNDIPKKRKLVKSVEQKIRREEKSLLREIRRDAQVVASEKLKETLEADEERKRKVKQLYAELSMQEGEYKKYAKRK
ncbi:nucleolar protein 14 homolog [Uloborus diversus]|uniref:nucleolar protein 14 homolog n=1 Tax=Uloborus diversus TaxID=327109 RepID=UPI002409BDE8|nr:nucleolar protein 14 homolog [Uloborus diversus]